MNSPSSTPTARSSSPKAGREKSTSDVRRARKREQDRHSQRLARERTKNRLAYLENLVQDLKQESTAEQVQSLLKQRDEIAKERDTLIQTLKSIKRAINGPQIRTLMAAGDKPMLEEPPATSSEDDLCDKGTHNMPLSPPVSIQQPHDVQKNQGAQTNEISRKDDGGSDLDSGMIGSAAVISCSSSSFISLRWSEEASFGFRQDDPIIPHAPATCDCSPSPARNGRGEVNFWRFANETLSGQPKWTEAIGRQEVELEHDTAIRAIVEGWDAVEKRAGGVLPPSWQALRKVDETIFIPCGPIERLAILKTMHTMFRYQQEISPKTLAVIPSWYLARPSQTIAHSQAIDYFAWPGVRERFVFSQHRYCSNLFWHCFQSGLRILWAYEFRDCYSRNMQTGEYCISPSFQERIRDINAWTMSPDMFAIWPELSSDIPHFNEIPGHIPNLEPWSGNKSPSKDRSLAAIAFRADFQVEEVEEVDETQIDEDENVVFDLFDCQVY